MTERYYPATVTIEKVPGACLCEDASVAAYWSITDPAITPASGMEVTVRVMAGDGTTFLPTASLRIDICFEGSGSPPRNPIDITCEIGKKNLLEEMCDVRIAVPVRLGVVDTGQYLATLTGDGNSFAPYCSVNLRAEPAVLMDSESPQLPAVGNFNVFEARSAAFCGEHIHGSHRIGDGNVFAAGTEVNMSLSNPNDAAGTIFCEKVFFMIDFDMFKPIAFGNLSRDDKTLLKVRDHLDGIEKNKLDVYLRATDAAKIIKAHAMIRHC
mmetsp:Transcript_45371/g.88664  ORF Transcript_45371/g.88664 Transcript_45371/m.88664 type:complete len:268 (+) Transcript_45371:222-1025(+)